MWQHNGKNIREGRSWISTDGIKHPTNWAVWSDSVKQSFGLVWVNDPAPYDSRFYWDADTPKALNDVNAVDEEGNALLDQDGNQVISRGLKWGAIQDTKRQAASKLAPTDWYVVKATEVADYTVPSEVTTYRAAVRTASNTIESAITNAADHDAFMALYNTPVDSDGNATGNAPIDDWPEEI